MRPPAPPLRTTPPTASSSTVTFRPPPMHSHGGDGHPGSEPVKKQVQLHIPNGPPRAGILTNGPRWTAPTPHPPPPSSGSSTATSTSPQMFPVMSPISEARSTPTTTTASPSCSEMQDANNQDSSSGCGNQDRVGDGNGFNSGCQQCVAERAAAEAVAVSSVSTSTSTEVASSSTINRRSVIVQGGTLEREKARQQLQQPRNGGGGMVFSEVPLENVFHHVEENRSAVRPGSNRNSMNCDTMSVPPPPPRPPPSSDPPGRAHHGCERLCREASRSAAGCVAVVLLALGYAAVGGALFMAIETRAANMIRETLTEEHAEREGPTVMNITTPLLEMPPEVRQNVDRARSETVSKLWMATEKMNILYPENWTRKAAEEILWFQDQLTKAFVQEFRSQSAANLQRLQQKQDGHGAAATEGLESVNVRPREWSFARGMLYSVSLLTTVGCGVDWAVTPLSRIASVAYLVIGAPILYLYLTSAGRALSAALHFIGYQLTCRSSRASVRSFRRGSAQRRSLSQSPFIHSATSLTSNGGASGRNTWQRSSAPGNVAGNGSVNTLTSAIVSEEFASELYSQHPKIALPIVCTLFLLFSYVTLGATLLSAEPSAWSFGEAFYFCFVSILTVGYGGIRIGESNAWPCVAYIFFGSAVLAACVCILKEDVVDKIAAFRAREMRRNKSKLTSVDGVRGKKSSAASR